jgi:hypothetical protein
MSSHNPAILGSYTLSRFIGEQTNANFREPSVSDFRRLVIHSRNTGTRPAPSNHGKNVRFTKTDTVSLMEIADGSRDNLLSIHTVYPFAWFADTLKVDRQKLTIVHKGLFSSSHTTSIRLKELRNVQSYLGPLYGSVTLTSQHFQNNTQTIKFLKRKDIIEAQRLLQGFMIAHEARIDTDNIEQKELRALLIGLGQENR